MEPAACSAAELDSDTEAHRRQDLHPAGPEDMETTAAAESSQEDVPINVSASDERAAAIGSLLGLVEISAAASMETAESSDAAASGAMVTSTRTDASRRRSRSRSPARSAPRTPDWFESRLQDMQRSMARFRRDYQETNDRMASRISAVAWSSTNQSAVNADLWRAMQRLETRIISAEAQLMESRTQLARLFELLR